MQALVLAGGEGTRLRPLTLTVPKPVLPLAGRPFLSFMLDWLARHGVDEAILSCGFLSEAVEQVLGHDHDGIRLTYVTEDQPLGTAGPVRLAADRGLLADRLFVLNGDVLTDIDLSTQLAEHDVMGAAATLALIDVEDTRSYGVVPTAGDRQVVDFVEKAPGRAYREKAPGRGSDRINAGAYVLERAVVDRIPAGRPVSFEREVFPALVGEGLYGWPAEGYWIDIGTPERYLEATYDLLAGRVESTLPPRDEGGSLVYDGCITSGAEIGPQAVVGSRCSVGYGSVIERAVLHEGVRVGSDCVIRESIVADGVTVGDDVRVEPGAVIGSGAQIASGQVVARDARIAPDGRVP